MKTFDVLLYITCESCRERHKREGHQDKPDWDQFQGETKAASKRRAREAGWLLGKSADTCPQCATAAAKASANLEFSIQRLRAALGDSQQKFAHRLSLSIRAITNYESGIGRPFAGILLEMKELAAERKLEDLAGAFAAAAHARPGPGADGRRS